MRRTKMQNSRFPAFIYKISMWDPGAVFTTDFVSQLSFVRIT